MIRALSTGVLVVHMSIKAGSGERLSWVTVAGMNEELRAMLDRAGGLVTRAQAAQVVPVWVVERARRSGQLCRVLSGVYRDPAVPATPALHRRAALAWLDGRGAVSHTTALAVWGLREPASGEPVHVTVPGAVRLRSRPCVVVHRRSEFLPEPPYAIVRGGQLVTPLDRSLVDAWPLLPAADRRAPVIGAVNDRRTTPGRLQSVLSAVPHLPGRVELDRLLGLLAAGCRSPLEIFGHEHVFTAAGMPDFQWQVRVEVGPRTIYMDVFAEDELVNVELDGASVHGNLRQREIDVRRDALLATIGILVVRFTHRRLVTETEAVQREVLAILASRRGIGGHRLASLP